MSRYSVAEVSTRLEKLLFLFLRLTTLDSLYVTSGGQQKG